MDPKNTENLDSQNEAPEVQESAPEQQVNETKDEFTDREKQYYERIKDLESKLKEKETPKEKPAEINSPQPKQGLDVEEKVELRLDNYSKDDINFIERSMGGRTLEETLADPRVKAGIEGVQATTKAEESTQAPSSTVPTFTSENKTWAQMTKDERKANYQQAIGNIGNQTGTRAE